MKSLTVLAQLNIPYQAKFQGKPLKAFETNPFMGFFILAAPGQPTGSGSGFSAN